jgi:hypothetical protein
MGRTDAYYTLEDFALKLKYPFQYPNRSNPGIITQEATIEDWMEIVKYNGVDPKMEFTWEYIEHGQIKKV